MLRISLCFVYIDTIFDAAFDYQFSRVQNRRSGLYLRCDRHGGFVKRGAVFFRCFSGDPPRETPWITLVNGSDGQLVKTADSKWRPGTEEEYEYVTFATCGLNFDPCVSHGQGTGTHRRCP